MSPAKRKVVAAPTPARKARPAGGMDAAAVARALRDTGALLRASGANPYRARAYERAAGAVQDLGARLPPLIAAGRLTELPGIGEALGGVIAELATTGRSEQLERLREEMPAGTVELQTVLKLPRIRALNEALGITTLAELEKACEEGKVREVKGFGAKSEAKILADIKSLATRGDDVLLGRALDAGDRLLARIRELPAVQAAELAGAARRRVELVGALDVVVSSSKAAQVLDHVETWSGAAATLGRTRSNAIFRLVDQVNARVRVVPRARHAWALLSATGSAEHLAQLGARARKRRIELRPTGMFRAQKALSVPDEAAAYRHLGLPWLAPELREGLGEIEAADAGKLPGRLLELEHVRGMVHCHTTYSDGTASVEDMARGADAMGMEYLTITDHSPTAHYAGGVTLDRLQRQWDDIDAAQEKVRVKLLRGTESDILADGKLDYPDEVLERFDVIVASVHNRYRMDADAMTRRVVTALRQPQFKIWGHALGRLIGRRPPFEVRMEEVLDAAAESRVAIEINGDPKRLDMEPKWIREARKRGIRFVVSADAHSVAAMRNIAHGVSMARRGWVQRGEVLNTLSASAFAAAVKPA